MRRREPLPPTLTDASFSVAEAEALGIGRKRLANQALLRPFHGVRVEAGAVNSPIAAFAPRLRTNEWFSHQSAARLWHVPLRDRERMSDAVHVTVRAPAGASRARGARGHQSAAEHPSVVRRFGLPCSDAADTWLSLAGAFSIAETCGRRGSFRARA
ncbi:hypothetical protein [Subtercola lobariae]|uniref:hypothetical protein n=1 Tax=Subtercola lobariae TaxID=1588641 RepID=UPI0016696C4F|nr:hypothetical protein [Subtercola lobariae]